VLYLSCRVAYCQGDLLAISLRKASTGW
jgi:hypothetical protein